MEARTPPAFAALPRAPVSAGQVTPPMREMTTPPHWTANAQPLQMTITLRGNDILGESLYPCCCRGWRKARPGPTAGRLPCRARAAVLPEVRYISGVPGPKWDLTRTAPQPGMPRKSVVAV